MKKLPDIRIMLSAFVLLVFVGAIATSVYFYREYKRVKENPDLISKEEVRSITDEIGRFIDLPSDEDPTLATVTDIEKLKDQEFFKNAQNGDKVLIYTRARKAILYRPSTGKIIEFAPLVIGEQNPEQTQNQQQAEPATVVIYNGTKTVGLTNEYEEKLAQIEGLSVKDRSNAAKNDYTQTFVIDITGNHVDTVQKITQLLDGETLDAIPDGEAEPQADILIIAGE
jgi:hypothetical protein